MNKDKILKMLRNKLLKYKGVWFCTCKDENHTTGCTRTTNRKIEDIIKEAESFLSKTLDDVEKEFGIAIFQFIKDKEKALTAQAERVELIKTAVKNGKELGIFNFKSGGDECALYNLTIHAILELTLQHEKKGKINEK